MGVRTPKKLVIPNLQLDSAMARGIPCLAKSRREIFDMQVRKAIARTGRGICARFPSQKSYPFESQLKLSIAASDNLKARK
jgi:hypothetical protein